MTSNQIAELERLIDVVASAPGIDGERLPILTQLRSLQQMLGARDELHALKVDRICQCGNRWGNHPAQPPWWPCMLKSSPKTGEENPQTSNQRTASTAVTFCHHWEEQTGAVAKGFGVLMTRIPQTCPWCVIQQLQGETEVDPDDAPDSTAKFAELVGNAAQWDRMFDAWVKHQAGLPSDVPLWPNPDWSQDVAMVAHALAQQVKTSGASNE